MIYYFLLLPMTLLGSVAALFLKRASGAGRLPQLLMDRNLYAGGFLYLVSAVLNIYLLRYLEYSVVLPLTSLTYLWTMILSRLVLGEKLTPGKIIGAVFLLAGAVLISL